MLLFGTSEHCWSNTYLSAALVWFLDCYQAHEEYENDTSF